MRRAGLIVTIVCCLMLSPGSGWAQEAPVAAPAGNEAAADAETAGKPEAPAAPRSLLDRFNFEGLLAENPLNSWLILLGAIAGGLVLGQIGGWILRSVARRLEARGHTGRAHLFGDLIGPGKLALLAGGLAIRLANIKMSGPLRAFAGQTLLLIYSIAVFWYAYNLVALVEVVLRRFTAKTISTLDDQLLPLIRKSLRGLLLVIAVLFVADSVFGQDIGAWLAGLGIAGLAVSLAAQDSLKNLFGSLTIILDQPFQLGERIRYASFDGSVEEIGFRSTKVRTLTGNLVTIPNSNIVNDPVENVARRPSLQRVMNIGICYDTPREKIEEAVEIVRRILDEPDLREPIHQVINGEPSQPRVYFNEFGASSLNISVLYWYAPPAWWDYMEHAQRVNLRLIEEFEQADIEFAFPTQTLHLAGDPKRRLAVKMLGEDLEAG